MISVFYIKGTYLSIVKDEGTSVQELSAYIGWFDMLPRTC